MHIILIRKPHGWHLLIGRPLDIDFDQSIDKESDYNSFTIGDGQDFAWRVILNTLESGETT